MLLPETEEEAERLATAWLSQVQELRRDIVDTQARFDDELAQKRRRVSGLLKLLDGLGTLWPGVPDALVKEERS